MATFEERLQAVERDHARLEQDHVKLEQDHAEIKQDNTRLKQDNAELKQKIELQTIAISGLVNKTVLEQVNNKNDKIFQTLINHDELTNHQLAEIRADISSLDGKTVGLQTEMRTSISNLDGKVVGLQAEMRQSFAAVNARFETMAMKDDLNAVKADVSGLKADVSTLKADMSEMKTRFETVDASLAQILQILHVLTQKPDQEK